MSTLFRRGVCLTLKLVALAGCKGEIKLPASFEEAKQTVVQQTQNVTETVKQTAGVAGKVSFDLDGAKETSAAYARLIIPGGSSPTVLQITSYNSPDNESFPSILFQGETTATTPAKLASQTISGTLYAAPTAESATFISTSKEPAELKIDSCDDGQLAGTISATLVDAATGTSKPVAMTVTAEMIKAE